MCIYSVQTQSDYHQKEDIYPDKYWWYSVIQLSFCKRSPYKVDTYPLLCCAYNHYKLHILLFHCRSSCQHDYCIHMLKTRAWVKFISNTPKKIKSKKGFLSWSAYIYLLMKFKL